MKQDPRERMAISAAAFFTVILLVVILLFGTVKIVPAGHRGVKTRLGAVVPGSLAEGIHFKWPFIEKIYIMDVRVQKVEADAAAASNDLQTVTSKIAVNFHVDPERAHELYQRVGPAYGQTVVAPAIQEAFKAVTARYSAERLITNRPEVSEAAKQLLQEKLRPYGLIVDGYNIIDFDFSQEFNRAIEAKQTAEQMALKAKRDLERVRIEAEQRVTQAKAEAEALRIQREALTPELLRLRELEAMRMAIEKWDGHLPSVTGGGVPFIQLSLPSTQEKNSAEKQ